MENLKNGKKVKVTIKADTSTLSVGLSECVSKTEIMPTSGYRVGTKNIPALFWNPMLSTSGKREIRGRKENGNDGKDGKSN